MDSNETPPPVQIMQYVMGSWVSQCVGTAARLKLPDHLAAGPRNAAALAQLCGANADAVHRLMRALAGLGLFTMNGDEFALTPLGATLRSDVPGSLRNFAIAETDTAHWLSWGRLTDAIRDGRKKSHDALGMEVWEYYGKHPEDGADFSRAMSDMSSMAVEPVLAAYDFAGASRVVDVGGAHGALLAGVLQKYPAASGVLFDLPHVADGARTEVERKGLSTRVEVVGGSFFEQVPAGGDFYLLKHILHDWDDERCVAILRTIRTAMKPTSRIVSVDFHLPTTAEPGPGQLMDVNMLVLLDGRERTAEQYGTLFARAGLRMARYIPTASPMAICEAVPA